MLAVTPFNRIMSSATQTKNISGMMWETGQRIHSLLNSPGLNLTKHLLEKSKSNQWKPHHNQPQRHRVHRPVALKCFVLYHWVKKTHLECMFIWSPQDHCWTVWRFWCGWRVQTKRSVQFCLMHTRFVHYKVHVGKPSTLWAICTHRLNFLTFSPLDVNKKEVICQQGCW